MQANAVTGKEEPFQQPDRFRSDETERGHESRRWSATKKFGGALGRYGNREWAERFAVLHKFVQVLLHVGSPGRRQQAAISERAWPEFGGAVKPPYDFSGDEQLNGLFQVLFL